MCTNDSHTLCEVEATDSWVLDPEKASQTDYSVLIFVLISVCDVVLGGQRGTGSEWQGYFRQT